MASGNEPQVNVDGKAGSSGIDEQLASSYEDEINKIMNALQRIVQPSEEIGDVLISLDTLRTSIQSAVVVP